jgi:stage V sporulation protein B
MSDTTESEVEKFSFDVSLTFIASIINLFILFLIVVFIGRYLGPADLGLYRIVSTIYGIAMLISAIGMPAAMVKYVAETKDDNQRLRAIVSSGVITSVLLGLGAIIIFYLLAAPLASVFNMPRLENLIRLLSVVFPFSLLGAVLLGILNGFREMGKFAVGSIFQNFLMVATTVALVLSGFGVTGAVLGLVISAMGGCLFFAYLSKGYLTYLTFQSFLPTTKSILFFGGQTFIGDAINTINYQADVILIGIFLSAGDVGIYSAAVGFSKFFWLVPNAVKTITYPATSEYWSKGNLRFLNKMIDKSMRYTASITSLLALGVCFFAEPIITIIFGAKFIDAVQPLRILVIGVVIFGIFKSVGSTLAGVGRPDLSVKANATGAVINVILNVSLIPILGIVGGAIATTISLILVSAISMYFMHKFVHIKINTRWSVKMISIISIVVLFFTLGLEKMNVYLLGSATLVIYAAMVFTFLLNKEDKDTFKTFICSTLFKFMRRNEI